MMKANSYLNLKVTAFLLYANLLLAAAGNTVQSKSRADSTQKIARQPRRLSVELLTTANDFYSFSPEHSQEQSYQPFSPFNTYSQTSAEQSEFNYDDPTQQNLFSPYFQNSFSYDQLRPTFDEGNFPFNTELTDYFGSLPNFNNNPTLKQPQLPQPQKPAQLPPQLLPQSPLLPQPNKPQKPPQLPQKSPLLPQPQKPQKPPQLPKAPQSPHLPPTTQQPHFPEFPHTTTQFYPSSQFPQPSPFPYSPHFPYPPPQEDLNTELLGSGNFGVIRGGTFYPDSELPFHSADGSETNDYSSDASNSHDDAHSTKVDFIKKYTYPEEQFEHFRDFAELGNPIDGAFSQRSYKHSKDQTRVASKQNSFPKNIFEKLQLIDREKTMERKKRTRSQSKVKLAKAKFEEKTKLKFVSKVADIDPLMALS